MEHVEEEDIHRGERADDTGRDEKKARVKPAVILHRRAGHRDSRECDGRGEEKHDEAQSIRAEDEIDAELRDDRETGDELETRLRSIESPSQNKEQDEIQSRGENRDGAGFSPEHHENGRDQRNEDQKEKRADGAHLESRM